MPRNIRASLADRFWGIFDNLAADLVRIVFGIIVIGLWFLFAVISWTAAWPLVLAFALLLVMLGILWRLSDKALRDKIEPLTGENARLTTENVLLKEEYGKARTEIEVLMAESRNLKFDIKNLGLENRSLGLENTRLGIENTKLGAEAERLRQKNWRLMNEKLKRGQSKKQQLPEG